ncbi:hypothetical protein BS17DRAFT_789951 [Gyrodon lividus]|nr:hypothetical protein BS17DRAFT_789873 [Gyrodon lividus]KAF9219181.1 hypothetical protein BS17DRAFT_789951 [Gyrodon lividus]
MRPRVLAVVPRYKNPESSVPMGVRRSDCHPSSPPSYDVYIDSRRAGIAMSKKTESVPDFEAPKPHSPKTRQNVPTAKFIFGGSLET